MNIESTFRVDSTITATLLHVGTTGICLVNLQFDSASIGMSGVLPGLTFDPPYPSIPVTIGTIDGMFAVHERLMQVERDIDFSRISDQTDLLLRNLSILLGETRLDSLLTSILNSSLGLNSQMQTWNIYGESLLLWSNTMINEAQEFTSGTIRTRYEVTDFIQELISLINDFPRTRNLICLSVSKQPAFPMIPHLQYPLPLPC